MTFATDDQTHYEVNGAALVGADGLDAVAALAAGTPVVAKGTVANRTLTASTVLAGSSVPWANGDVLNGVVTARSGDTLTVKGVDFDFADGTHGFRGSFTVLVGEDTRVTSLDSDTMTRNKGSISVGQRIVAFGQLSDPSTLDATAGRVRMDITRLTGNVVQLDPLVVNLVELGGLRPGAFDFGGTGTSAATDADPAHYGIDTSTLSLVGVDTNDLVKVRGIVHDENAWALTGTGGSGHAGIFGTAPAVLAFGCAVLDALKGRGGPFAGADLSWLVSERPGGTLRAGFDGKSAPGAYSSCGDRAR